MKKSYKLIDNCEFNNVCFSDLVSDLKRIIDNQTIIFNMLIEAVEQFGRWVYAGGRKLNGLIRRRQAEKELFMDGIYATT